MDDADMTKSSTATNDAIELGAPSHDALRRSERRLRSVLDMMSEGYALFSPDLIILDVNQETLRLDGRSRHTLVGRSHWDAFPGSEESALGDLYRSVMRDREPDTVECHYPWPDGRDMWVAVRAYPTEDGGVASFWRDVTADKQVEATIREAAARRLLLQAAWETDPHGVVTADSPSWRAYTGQTLEEWLGYGWLDAIHPEDRAYAERQWLDAVEKRGLVNAEFRLRAPDGGWRWTNVLAAPVFDARGAIEKWAGMNVDIDARKRSEASLLESEARLQVLVAELQHRVRNILTVIRSVFTRTANANDDRDELVRHFQGRLSTLARTHVLVTRTAEGTALLEDLIRDELLAAAVSDGPKLSLDGPEVELDTRTAETLGLAIHELTTNALKYGALAYPSGALRISWKINPNQRGEQLLDLVWVEEGVPTMAIAPSRLGFGRELIEEVLPYQLRAATMLELRGGGVRCSISLPLTTNDDPH
jgi:PAS domain S-box-containing protein